MDGTLAKGAGELPKPALGLGWNTHNPVSSQGIQSRVPGNFSAKVSPPFCLDPSRKGVTLALSLACRK